MTPRKDKKLEQHDAETMGRVEDGEGLPRHRVEDGPETPKDHVVLVAPERGAQQ